MARKRDFREFAFVATGGETQIQPLGTLDLLDNLYGEVRRLEAISELLGSANLETIDTRSLPGVSDLLDDIGKRMRVVLDHGMEEVRRQAPGDPAKSQATD